MKVVGIGGTRRAGSNTERALRFALAECESFGATTSCFGSAELLDIPHYDPENLERNETVLLMIKELRDADGIVLASPGYHGTVSGLVKNALDYAEDLRDDDRAYLSGRAVGCIATGAGWQGIMTTLATLRFIVHSLRGWPTPLGVAINTSTPVFDSTGALVQRRVETNLTTLAAEVASFRLEPPAPLL